MASVGKKRETSIGSSRNAELPKSRQKVARKGDANPADNVVALRQKRALRDA